MRTQASTRQAAVAWSGDPDPRRAGLLAAAEAASTCGRESIRSVVVFASGSHSTATAQVARGAAEHLPDATIVVIGGGGVLTPDGESEGKTAVTALTLRSSMAVAVARASGAGPAAMARALAAEVAADRPRPTLLFCQPRAFTPAVLEAFAEAARPQVLIGGGLSPEGRLSVVSDGALESGIALAARLDGGVRLSVGVSPGIRALSPPLRVDEIDNGFVTSLGGRRPLDVLTESVQGRADRPLVLAAIEPPIATDAELAPPSPPLVRPIGGVNPTRGGVHVGDEVSVGDRVAFAALDPDAAREHLETTMREVLRDTAGGVPLAALYIDCAGRGQRLYGRPGVDAKIIRARLGDVPFAGLHSSFEIAPFAGRPRVHTFTGVIGLLYAPS